MNDHFDKEYKPYKLPERHKSEEDSCLIDFEKPIEHMSDRQNSHTGENLPDGMYYEIEYDSSPIPGVGKFVLKSQKLEEPKYDRLRELFGQMRDIARQHRLSYDFKNFFDRRAYYDNSIIFYKQGMFMKDFEDDYSDSVPLSQYFPSYQLMGYEQLRTYFTWRKNVRQGTVAYTSLSYAYLYIYELLNNIGVEDSEDGLERLLFFWREFREYDDSIDKYVLAWLKDYHIYYDLPQSFKEFITVNDLTLFYPGVADADDNFDLFCNISKYDIRKSAFFSEDRTELITNCFYYITDEIRDVFSDYDIDFDEAIFQPTRKMSVWTPFKSALFYNWLSQPDRKIVLSEKEIYLCENNNWTFSSTITTESGRQLIGYIFKQMEVILRRLTGYKYKLSADINIIKHEIIDELKANNIAFDKLVEKAVISYYKEATKTVVKVDLDTLTTIRKDAMATQESLIIPEEEIILNINPIAQYNEDNNSEKYIDENNFSSGSLPNIDNSWSALKSVLTDIETGALAVLMNGEPDIKRYADNHNIMLEVLIDSINEKAMDYIGDNLIDEEYSVYEDYKDVVNYLISN